ncbi:unnamed protein product [Clonostachys solani]|uniref:Uncharacterized protein n=1 Tax=Clonostachys solani TaxID=160281 RepID=A0A9P0ENP4_9HYPO|nr:unnamed protein product [Clonostachys solani]
MLKHNAESKKGGKIARAKLLHYIGGRIKLRLPRYLRKKKVKGILEEAEKLKAQVLEILQMKLKADHPDILTSQWEEAEKLKVQVVETHKIKLGADHPSTLTSIANLTSTYTYQGR